MSDNNNDRYIPIGEDNNSSILKKTDPALRRQLNLAIVNRDPPTYRAIFDRFDLAARNISFTAFYYYARRIRMSAAMVELTRDRVDTGADPEAVITDVLAERLLEAALDEDATPATIHRLARAYHNAAKLRLDRRRILAQLQYLATTARRNEPDRLSNMDELDHDAETEERDNDAES